MISIISLFCDIQIDSNDFVKILKRISEKGWTPALYSTQQHLKNVFEINDETIIPIRRSRIRRRKNQMDYYPGDIFIQENDIYYLSTLTIDRNLAERGAFYYYEDEPEKEELEVGILAMEPSKSSEKIQSFASIVKEAIIETLDGRKTRNMKFDWTEKKIGTPNLDKIKKESETKSQILFKNAILDPSEVSSINIFSDKNIRELLIEINQSGFVRQRDLMMRKQKGFPDLNDILTKLKNHSLLNTEYLIECKKTNTPLTRIQNKDILEKSELGDLICPSCTARFKNENILEGYSLSDLTKKMLKQSYWMTVWVTDILKELGIDENAILWNISDSGEEVDILAEVFGRLWIFELKDREFGSGDAYPLNYRKVRYRADKSIIITAESVSKEAKKVFEELKKESESDRELPIYIEGLDNARPVLSKELSSASLLFAYRKFQLLSDMSGFELISLVAKRLSKDSA